MLFSVCNFFISTPNLFIAKIIFKYTIYFMSTSNLFVC